MKRVISFIMVLVMLIGVMPIPAGAEEMQETTLLETTAESEPEEVTEASTEPPATSEAVEETQPQETIETQPQETVETQPQETVETQPQVTEETQVSEPVETEPEAPEILSWEEYRYTLLADGTASICGFTGTPEDADKPFLVEIPDAIQGVVVTQIAEKAFAGNEAINAALLPETIRVIGSGAFEDCKNLKVIAFCGDAPTFGATLVKGCDNLTEIDVLENRDYSVLKELVDEDLGRKISHQSFKDRLELEESLSVGQDRDSSRPDTHHFFGQSETAEPVAVGTFDNHQYAIYDLSMTWMEAKAYCEELGGHLVTITSEEEQAFIENLLPEPYTKRQYWLGATSQSGEWVWVTGEPMIYSNWDNGQPDHNGDGYRYEEYAEIYNYACGDPSFPATRYKWNDIYVDNDVGDTTLVGADYIGFVFERDLSNYDTVLEQYRQAYSMSADEFYNTDIATVFPYINEMMLKNYHSYGNMEFFYTFWDLNWDGIDELLISKDGGVIVGLYTFDGRSVVTLNNTVGYRHTITAYSNGIIRIQGSESASLTRYSYYEINGSKSGLELKKEFFVDSSASNADAVRAEIAQYESKLTELMNWDWKPLFSNDEEPVLNDWQKAYYDYVVADKDTHKDWSDWEKSVTYELIYLDTDDIPELWIEYDNYYDGGFGFSLLLYNNGSVESQSSFGVGNIEYLKRGNLFKLNWVVNAYSHEIVYSLENGIKENLGGYDLDRYGNGVYTWQGLDISSKEYEDTVGTLFPSDSIGKTHSENSILYDYDGILEYLIAGFAPTKPAEPIFNEYTYRADYLLGDHPASLNYYLDRINKYSPTQIVLGVNDLASINDLWRGVTVTLDTVSDGDGAVKEKFKQDDVYEAILLNMLEATADPINPKFEKNFPYAKEYVKNIKQTMSSVQDIIEVEYHWKLATDMKIADMSPKQREEYSEALKKALAGGPLAETVDLMKKSAKVMDEILTIADTAYDFATIVIDYATLWSITDSMALTLDEMYRQTPNNSEYYSMRKALSFCSEMIKETSEEQFLNATFVHGFMTTVGEYSIKKGISYIWDKVKDAATLANPELEIVLFAYKASRTVCNMYFNTDEISEQTYKLCVINQYYTVVNNTISALVSEYKQDKTSQNAEALLNAVTLLFNLSYEDCSVCASFADAVDQAFLYRIEKLLYNKTGAADVKSYANATKESFMLDNQECTTNWIFQLEADFPEAYKIYENYLNNKVYPDYPDVTKTYIVACPVNVFVYDYNQNLVASVCNGVSFSSKNVTAELINGEKFINFYDAEEYRIVCEGYDSGNMNITIKEYNGQYVSRKVFFNDLIVTNKLTYELNAVQHPAGEKHSIICDGMRIFADIDSSIPTDINQPIFIWAANNTCTAVFGDVSGMNTYTIACTVTSSFVPATVSCGSKMVYTASARYNGKIFTNIKEVPAQFILLEQDYITVSLGGRTQLAVKASSDALVDIIEWSAEDATGIGTPQPIVRVDSDGTITAVRTGTAYVTASVTIDGVTYSDRCRVDVTAQESSVAVQGAQLGTTALTTELFKTDYVSFDVILQLKQNESRIMSADALSPDSAVPEDNGVAITSARFEDEQMDALFALAVKDDRTLLVVPRQTAVDNPNTVGKSYSGKVIVNVGGEEFTTDSSLKLTVKKTMPKLKVASLSFNSFYTNQAQPIVITGATVTGISRNTAKDTTKIAALPNWLTLSDGVLTLTDDAPAKSASGSAYVLVETEEWAMPIAVTVPVKLAYKAPGLKLSASSVTFANAGSSGVSLRLLCSRKADTLSALNVSGIRAPEGFDVRNFNRVDGSFTLVPNGAIVSETRNIVVSFSDTDKTVALKLKVSAKAVTLSAKPKTVTLNSVVGDSAVIPLTASPADYKITATSFRLTDSSGAETTQLDFAYSVGAVTVKTNASTKPGSTYKLYISSGGSKETVITVKTLAEKNSKPTLSAKITGTINLSFPESYAIVTPSFRNYGNGLSTLESWTVTESKGKTNLGDATDAFELDYRNSQYRLLANGDLTVGNTYMLTMTFSLADGSTYSCSVKIPVRRTAVKLKLSTTTLSLNKSVEDMVYLDLQCLTKNYALRDPLISAPENLFVNYRDGRLFVAVNAKTEFGATYRVSVRATQYDAPVTLTVKIPAENKSAVTATLKAVGQLDVVRDSTAVTVTPTYKNVLRTPNTYWQMDVYSSADNYATPVAGLFHVEKTESGSFAITRAEGAQINAKLKYRAVLTSKFENVTVKSAPIALKVTAGSAKITAQAPGSTLYAVDKNSRADFRLIPGDSELNRILSVRLKNQSDRNLFELFDYGNGAYAVGFRNGEVDQSLLFGKTAINLPLEVILDGNGTPGAIVSTTLKVSFIPYSKITKLSIYGGIYDLTGKTTNLDAGCSRWLSVKTEPADTLKQVTWTSSDPTVATVDSETGVVEAHKVGKTVIICTANDGSRKSASMTLNVTAPILVDLTIRQTFCLGDTLDARSLMLKAFYQSGWSRQIVEGFTCTPSVLNEVGTQTVTVTYGGMEKNFQVEVLDFYELSAEVENVCGEGYNEDGRVNWILYVTGRYTGNYTDFSFQTNLPVPYGTTTKLELDWNDALNGQGGGWDYSCIERGFGEYHGGHAFILPDNPMLAGRYSATLSFGDVTKTVYFTLVYNGNYTSGTGWSVTNVSWK